MGVRPAGSTVRMILLRGSDGYTNFSTVNSLNAWDLLRAEKNGPSGNSNSLRDDCFVKLEKFSVSYQDHELAGLNGVKRFRTPEVRMGGLCSSSSRSLHSMSSGSRSEAKEQKRIEVPWGDETLTLSPPADWKIAELDVVWPDRTGLIRDYQGELDKTLDAPEGLPRLRELVRPGAKVAIVVDDPSRWTPVKDALPNVLRRLHAAGVKLEDVTISVGVGRHHAVDPEAMRRRVGVEIASTYRCFSPPVDDRSAYADLGKTPEGLPVLVFRPVAEADLRILIGSVLPHLQAGFGGGYKLIFPGTSHRETLGALHRQGLGRGGDAGVLLGSEADRNPMRRAILAAAGLLGPCFSISHLVGSPGEILRIAAGSPPVVQDRLAVEAKSRFQAPPSLPADIIVAGNHPWPGDPMQSFKVLLQHRSACREGGVLIGLFWTDPVEIDRSFPLGLLRGIAASGAPGGWAIRRLLPIAERAAAAGGATSEFMIRWARELVVDRTVLVLAPPLRRRIGPRLGPVRLFEDQESLWRAAQDALAVGRKAMQPPSLRIFPQGGLTYSPQRPNDPSLHAPCPAP